MAVMATRTRVDIRMTAPSGVRTLSLCRSRVRRQGPSTAPRSGARTNLQPTPRAAREVLVKDVLRAEEPAAQTPPVKLAATGAPQSGTRTGSGGTDVKPQANCL